MKVSAPRENITKFKEGSDPLYHMSPKLKKVKDKENYRSYPKTEDIIDFDFKPGGEVKTMKKEKKPPKHGKIKMKTYGHSDWRTRV